MAFYVVLPDGQRDGPLDLEALQRWATEGRLKPFNYLVEVETGSARMAKDIPGIGFHGERGSHATYWYPSGQSMRVSGGPASNYSAAYGAGIVGLFATLCGGVGFAVGFLCSLAAIGLATNIRYSRPEQVRGPLWFSLFALCVNVALILLSWLHLFSIRFVF